MPAPPPPIVWLFKGEALESIVCRALFGHHCLGMIPKAYRINKVNNNVALCRVIMAIPVLALLACPPSLSKQ